MTLITSILLNYKRPGNLKQIIEGIRAQTIGSFIWIWDNSNKLDIECDLLIRSSKNLLCQPRVSMASFVQTPYIWTQDDDRIIRDKRLFEKLIDISEEYENRYMLCPYGKNFKNMPEKFKETPYFIVNGEKVPGWVFQSNIKTDFGATGYSFMPTMLINKLPINPFNEITEEEYKFGDDMYISYYLDTRVCTCINKGVEQIPEDGQGLNNDEKHYEIRNKLCRRYWL